MDMNEANIGKYTYHGDLILAWQNQKAEYICGKFCVISNLKVYLGGDYKPHFISNYSFGSVHKNIFDNFNGSHDLNTNGNVIIGNDVWIGDNVTIMSGVKVGDGAIIAPYSHVISDVEPYSIVCGNPAKIINYRFSKEQIQKLLVIKWWNWDEAKINKFVNNLCSVNIDEFISLHYVNSGIPLTIENTKHNNYNNHKFDNSIIEQVLIKNNKKIVYIVDINDSNNVCKKENTNSFIIHVMVCNENIHNILSAECCFISLSIMKNDKTRAIINDLMQTALFYNYTGLMCFITL